MTERPLRVGLIGAGWVSAFHLKAWIRLKGRAEIVAICDTQRVQAEKRATEFGISSVYADAADMLEYETLDAVDIAVPRAAHVAMVELAAGKDLAVLCQKPLAPSLREAEWLVQAVSGRIRLMVHENWRFRAYYRQIAAWLAEGRVGTIKTARLTLVTSGMLPDQDGRFPALERQPFLRGEARMLVAEILIHHLDTLRMLLGPLQVKAASLTRTCPELIGEDGAVIQMHRMDGTAVSVFANFGVHGAPPMLDDQLEIIGDLGLIRLDGKHLMCLGNLPGAHHYDAETTYQGSYDQAIGHFVDCLVNGAEFDTSADDNLATLRLVEDCYRLSGWNA